MSDITYRCTACGVFMLKMPDFNCPNCDAFTDDIVIVPEDMDAIDRGEMQVDSYLEDKHDN